jgi:hypothetical protein
MGYFLRAAGVIGQDLYYPAIGYLTATAFDSLA